MREKVVGLLRLESWRQNWFCTLVKRSAHLGYRARKHSEAVTKESVLGKLTCHVWSCLSNTKWSHVKWKELGKSVVWLAGLQPDGCKPAGTGTGTCLLSPVPAFHLGQKLSPKPPRKRLLGNLWFVRGISERFYSWFKAPGGAEKNLGRTQRKKGLLG